MNDALDNIENVKLHLEEDKSVNPAGMYRVTTKGITINFTPIEINILKNKVAIYYGNDISIPYGVQFVLEDHSLIEFLFDGDTHFDYLSDKMSNKQMTILFREDYDISFVDIKEAHFANWKEWTEKAKKEIDTSETPYKADRNWMYANTYKI